MANNENPLGLDPEIAAINTVVLAIRDLDASTQQNVVDYVIRRFRLHAPTVKETPGAQAPAADSPTMPAVRRQEDPPFVADKEEDDALAGVSPVARKWLSRSALSAENISKLFSLGIDEIDLVAKDVPGKSKRERMRSVILLKAVAAYLGTGVARVAHEQVKETCLHYSAWDATNSAAYFKDFSAEVGGSKESGYTLTARGLTAATEIVKSIATVSSK